MACHDGCFYSFYMLQRLFQILLVILIRRTARKKFWASRTKVEDLYW